MIQKLSGTLAILFVSLFVTNPVRSVEPYYADAFDVQIELQEGGSAVITETIEFQFGGSPSTSLFRKIPATNTDRITFLDASMDGMPMPQGRQTGQVEVEAGNPLRVTWRFLPTSQASHIFAVRYLVEGIIRKGNTDTLVWRVIPEEHDYSIVHSTITLDYPLEPPQVEQPASGRKLDVFWEDDRLILTASEFGKNEDLVLIARFDPDSLIEVAPQWQVKRGVTNIAVVNTLSVGFSIGMVVLIAGGLWRIKRGKFNKRQWTKEFIR